MPERASADSRAVSLCGKAGKTGPVLDVTIFPNNGLRHSRQTEQADDDWISPALPAPAFTPAAGVIGLTEESFGLRKSPTVPMVVLANSVWMSDLSRTQATRVAGGQAPLSDEITHRRQPWLERPTTQIPREGDVYT